MCHGSGVIDPDPTLKGYSKVNKQILSVHSSTAARLFQHHSFIKNYILCIIKDQLDRFKV